MVVEVMATTAARVGLVAAVQELLMALAALVGQTKVEAAAVEGKVLEMAELADQEL